MIKLEWRLVSFLLLFLIGLSACQPQTIEVEVTRVVTETIIIEIEGETVEVKVTRVVVQEAEREIDAIEEEAPVEEPFGGMEATGSEEDGGSPFVPGAGSRFKITPTRVASAGRVDLESIAAHDGLMRLIEENQQAVVVIHQLDASYGRSTLMIGGEDMVFAQSLSGLPPVALDNLTLPAEVTGMLANLQPTDELVERSVQLSCSRCTEGGTAETVVILWPASGLTLTFDQGAGISEIDGLLNLLRPLHNRQFAMAALRAFRLGELENR